MNDINGGAVVSFNYVYRSLCRSFTYAPPPKNKKGVHHCSSDSRISQCRVWTKMTTLIRHESTLSSAQDPFSKLNAQLQPQLNDPNRRVLVRDNSNNGFRSSFQEDSATCAMYDFQHILTYFNKQGFLACSKYIKHLNQT